MVKKRKTNKKKKGGFSSFFSKKRPLDNKLNAFYDSQNINCENMVTEGAINIPNNAILTIPFPLINSLLDYKGALEQQFFYYGR